MVTIHTSKRSKAISIAFAFLFFSCGREQKDTLFTSLSGDQTGIHFSNTIREDDSTQSFIDEFGYMGGG
ncbi:MAG TPA: hypothetical protein VL832_23945, partial [Puia sp.]|nr:hypothetical protein [Puia sp.]